MSQRPTGRLAEAPKYINDFSKALASEVRILLQEVGKLRDERRALQFEIAQLLSLKSQHGPGGEFAPDWKPDAPAEKPRAPEAPMPPPTNAPSAQPAWRVIETPRKIERKKKMPKSLAPGPSGGPMGGPMGPIEPPRPPPPSWTTWQPNPRITPVVKQPPVPPLGMPQHVPGLFGPRTPPPQ